MSSEMGAARILSSSYLPVFNCGKIIIGLFALVTPTKRKTRKQRVLDIFCGENNSI